MKPRIHIAHLFNDYSGSPRVLKQVITSAIERKREVSVYLGNNSEGILSGINGVNYHFGGYKFTKSKIVLLLFFINAQLRFFIKGCKNVKRGDVVYVNTFLPFGFALGGFIKRGKVIYHIHETSLNPILKWLLKSIAELVGDQFIFVSKYLKEKEGRGKSNEKVIYNALCKEFISKDANSSGETVLMLSSLKKYKGVYEFVELARMCPDCPFELVLNASPKEVERFKGDVSPPQNLTLFSSQKDVSPFYQRARVVLNLSHPTGWVETFGLTVIESNYFGVPVIVPEVGGIAEIVKEGTNGFRLSVTNLDLIAKKIKYLYSKTNIYTSLKRKARVYSKSFYPSNFVDEIFELIQGEPYLN